MVAPPPYVPPPPLPPLYTPLYVPYIGPMIPCTKIFLGKKVKRFPLRPLFKKFFLGNFWIINCRGVSLYHGII